MLVQGKKFIVLPLLPYALKSRALDRETSPSCCRYPFLVFPLLLSTLQYELNLWITIKHLPTSSVARPCVFAGTERTVTTRRDWAPLGSFPSY